MAIGRRLYVLVHGLNGSPAKFDGLWSLIRARDPSAERFSPRLDAALGSVRRADRLAADLAVAIGRECDDLAAQGRPVADIVLIGHSAGALLARAAWLFAQGVQPDGSVHDDLTLPWATKVRRMVLVAALAAGWRANVAMSPSYRLALWFAGAIDYLPFFRLFVFDLRRGSAFLSGLRLRWIALSRTRPLPTVVQLVGTVDDLVAPADHIDLVTGEAFHYLEVEGAGHADIISTAHPNNAEALDQALFASPDQLDALPYAVPPGDMADLYSDAADDFDSVSGTTSASPPEPQPAIDRAVMVIHGIRDYGFWTKRLAGRIKRVAKTGDPVRGRPALECRTVTSSYGFFPMAPFVFGPPRRLRAEWFMDQYVRTRAQYPDAAISFVGHSNGTYLLAESLRLCPAIKLDAVVFAGSVVSPAYDWTARRDAGQVRRVLNFVATEDVVVAAFPKFLGWLGFDLGGAGHDGFDDRAAHNLRFAPGQHDAGIKGRQWDGIARYVLFGDDPEDVPLPGLFATHRPELPMRMVTLLTVPLLLILAGLIVWAISLGVGVLPPSWLAALVVAGFALALFKPILTKL